MHTHQLVAYADTQWKNSVKLVPNAARQLPQLLHRLLRQHASDINSAYVISL